MLYVQRPQTCRVKSDDLGTSGLIGHIRFYREVLSTSPTKSDQKNSINSGALLSFNLTFLLIFIFWYCCVSSTKKMWKWHNGQFPAVPFYLNMSLEWGMGSWVYFTYLFWGFIDFSLGCCSSDDSSLVKKQVQPDWNISIFTEFTM